MHSYAKDKYVFWASIDVLPILKTSKAYSSLFTATSVGTWEKNILAKVGTWNTVMLMFFNVFKSRCVLTIHAYLDVLLKSPSNCTLYAIYKMFKQTKPRLGQ